ncbi:NADH-quinone oxidoreductase subunit C [Candidatus Aminicenantes bacterium AC-334-K16]|jgi:NADH-quinone oxidoreductase subunit C|nr:NADH-quinone oxidoreductase subunit C [Candidatus Aminicenantes bacterium AC-334-K16]
MEKEVILKALQDKFAQDIIRLGQQFGDDIIQIKKKALLPIVNFLRKEPYEFTMLLDLTCVDYLDDEERFEMVYHLFSLKNNIRLRIKARLKESDLKIDSVTSIWKNANWLEREVYDMFGVQFEGHPDLRRIFMYDGFEGYPLRKDYPLRKRQPRIPLKRG